MVTRIARAKRESGSKVWSRVRVQKPWTCPWSMRLRSFAWVSCVILFAPACSSDRSALALSARIDSPSLDVQASSVGADATGTFSLAIELGEYATEDTKVSLGTFAVQRGDMELITPLSLAGATFPVSLGVGKKVMLPLTFGASTEAAMATTICQAPIEVRGTLTDTLSDNRPTVVMGSTFTAQCN